MSTALVELKVDRLIRGALPDEVGGQVIVEFAASFDGEVRAFETVGRLEAAKPAAGALWLLRWQGVPPSVVKPGAPERSPTQDLRYFEPVHYEVAAFVTTTSGVRSALAPSASVSIGAARREAESMPSLDALAEFAASA